MFCLQTAKSKSLYNSSFKDSKKGMQMPEKKANVFELVLLIVGIGSAILGFQLINQVYKSDTGGQISWLMIIAIFNWLTLLVLFILLSLMVDVSKKELAEIKKMIAMHYANEKKK